MLLQIATILCLAAAANAAAVLPVETSVVKSDRMGDNFSYSIHQNQGYALSDLADVYPYEVKGDKIKQVVPATAYVAPVGVKSTEYKQVVPVAQYEEYKHVVPVSPIQLKSTVLPGATYVSAEQLKNLELKSYVQPAYVAPAKGFEFKSYVQPTTTVVAASPVRSVGYIQPSPAISYSHDAALPISYGASFYPYATYSYPIVKPEKIY